jgi:hypothetical protein
VENLVDNNRPFTNDNVASNDNTTGDQVVKTNHKHRHCHKHGHKHSNKHSHGHRNGSRK